MKQVESVAKDIFVFPQMFEKVCARMGWQWDEDEDFWYVSLDNSDEADLFHFLFDEII